MDRQIGNEEYNKTSLYPTSLQFHISISVDIKKRNDANNNNYLLETAN